MTEAYANYLQSPQWAATRARRLALSRFCCDSCGSDEIVQVHHLTYERIFNESMGDLMCLCRYHHQLAEKLIKAGDLTRVGDPKTNEIKTLNVLGWRFVPKPPPKSSGRTPQEIQHELTRDPVVRAWITTGCKRKVFMKCVRKRFKRHPEAKRMECNALIVYDRLTKK